jgi:RNA polymerase sigma-70 factor (ECF subfamily)
MRVMTNGFEEDGSDEPVAPRDQPVVRLDLERAVQQLPDGYRAAFVLHDVEGLDHKQIAGLLGISEGTSRSQVFKARMKLRTLLG